jgi:3-hydroxybutyryl-CoA dehydrogenase
MNEAQWPDAPGSTRGAVIGGGTMGADVAVVLLRASCATVVVEPNASLHPDIRAKITDNLAAIGKADNTRLLTLVTSLDALDWPGIGLVIECVPESLDIKRRLFRALTEKASAHTVLASNSSSFPISQIAQDLDTRERMVGLHFFMPAHLVPLVEVVLGADTDATLAESLAAFMRRCGSVPIVVRKDVPGFIGNRLQHALAREAFALIQEGIVSPEDIDAAVRFGFGFRYLAAGPVLQKEHAGLDVHAAAAATIYPSLSNAVEPAPILADKPRQGKLGMKTGEGFYRWDEASIKAEKQRYERALKASLEILAKELPAIRP